MERICEPELMEDPARARAYAEADFSRTDGAMVEGLLALWLVRLQWGLLWVL